MDKMLKGKTTKVSTTETVTSFSDWNGDDRIVGADGRTAKKEKELKER